MNYRSASIIIAIPFIAIAWCQAYAQGPQEILVQYLSELQRDPNDSAIREKIIRHVQVMRQKPKTPEEAKKYLSRGMAAIEAAKTDADFKVAAAEFEKVVNYAPWVGEGYRNLGIALDKAGLHDAAIKNLNLYLLTNPADADKAKEVIYKIEFKAERQKEDERKKADLAERERQKQEVIDKFKRIVQGSLYEESFCNGDGEGKCNEEEKNGTNWMRINKLNKMGGFPAKYHSFNFTPDGKIKFGNYLITLEGENTLCTDTTGKSLWFSRNSDWSSFTFSYDRPPDGVGYDPSHRYMYFNYKRN